LIIICLGNHKTLKNEYQYHLPYSYSNSCLFKFIFNLESKKHKKKQNYAYPIKSGEKKKKMKTLNHGFPIEKDEKIKGKEVLITDL